MAELIDRTNEGLVEGQENNKFSRNINAEVENPLDRLTPDALSRDTAQFWKDYGLSDVMELELLEKAGQVARDPTAYDAITNLTQDEREALHDEKNKRFKQPFTLYATLVVCSFGAAVQGWDQTGSNGANLVWPKRFRVDPKHSTRDNFVLGIVNAAPYFASSLLGCWLSDPLNARLGRRGTIFFAALFCFLSAIGSAFAQSWPQLLICRLLLGVGMGAKASTIPVLTAESAPANIRGSLGMSWQLWVSFGIFLGFSANLAIFRVHGISWRLQLGSASIPAVPLLIGIFFCPESPRWYMKKGRYHDAYDSLRRLRRTPLQAARDLYFIHSQLKKENFLRRHGDKISNNYMIRLVQLFTVPRIRRATLASATVMLAQQLCGINILAFYSSTLFQDAYNNTEYALLASWGFGLVNFVFALPSVYLIDKYGRRSLLLFTFPHMAWCMAAAAFSFYVPGQGSAHIGLVTFFIFLFAAFYSPGEGPVPFTYSAEAFPLHHRGKTSIASVVEVGMSFSVATNFFWAGILTVTFPHLSNGLGPTAALGLFAGFNLIALVMIFLWVPETSQRTLEELNDIFAVPTKQHMHYQLFQRLPFLLKRYVLRRDVESVPLYKFKGLRQP